MEPFASRFQGTVTRVIEFAGVGLHTGRLVRVKIQPAGPNQGVRFRRLDAKAPTDQLAHPRNVTDTTLCTSIGLGDQRISTIEHLMAAFAGTGIDNAVVEVNACELPILDGSSAPFVDLITEGGVQLQNIKRPILSLRESVEVSLKDQYMRFDPWPYPYPKNEPPLQIDCTIDFKRSKIIGKQTLSFQLTKKAFQGLCEARTFCHMDDVSAMRARGLALGGSLDNAVVVNDFEVLNNDGLRYPDEFVRHKILDCIGDLALLGGHLMGKITLYKGGHRLHNLFTKKVLEVLAIQEAPLAREEAFSSVAKV